MGGDDEPCPGSPLSRPEDAPHHAPALVAEKRLVAATSVVAAVFLTVFKVVVGVITGSLGILAEAAHSLLDLVAAVMTLWAVRASAQPADGRHTYGHGKFENFSALVETPLLARHLRVDPLRGGGTALLQARRGAGQRLGLRGHGRLDRGGHSRDRER